MNADTVIFFISAVVAVFGATMMISQRNAVASVLYLIVSLVAQVVCYVQLGALFIGAVLILVYAGAILVLFLFVIMLLNLRGGEDLGEPSRGLSRYSTYLVSILLIIELVFVIKGVFYRGSMTGVLSMAADNFGEVAAVSKLLFTRYLYPFELTGVLLLAAIVGAVVLARRETGADRPATGERQGRGENESSGGVE
ncbi:MAG TPA: NADH-quinone oxidoreductase subunit J [Acidobacteriota bacterium]|nr:NADH-quinone oxidoreductase subunit J [Acidobacteriota bacterium]